jgi:hypothetical protein
VGCELSVDILTRLIEAGTPAALVAEVAAALARASADRDAIEGRRTRDRERQASRRHAMSRDVTLDDVTSRDTADEPPLLDKETLSPTPPIKEINHTPRVIGALARKAAGFGPPEAIEVDRWNVFCSQRKKALTRIAYDRIAKTLTDAASVGWPPGEVLDRSIESGWETVFVPKEAYGGRRNGSIGVGGNRGQSASGFGKTVDAAQRALARHGYGGAETGDVP